MSAPAVEAATIARHGTALCLGLSGGHEHILRLIDLPSLPVESPSRARFARVEVDDGDVRVELVDGIRFTLAGGDLVARCRDLARPDHAIARASDLVGDLVIDLVIDNIGLLLTASPSDGSGDALGLVPDAAMACGHGRVLWLGRSADLDAWLKRSGGDPSQATRLDAGGRLVTPGLVDCHAHPLFGGNRADEFARRARGQSYLEIAAAGGGIKATIEPTRRASIEDHIALTCARMARALAAGTTTCEAKSGYDLSAEGELRLLEIAWAADAVQPVDLVPTLLGAHILPPEYADDRAAFVDLVCDVMVAETARRGLATMADVYCDQGAFTLEETRQILTRAQAAGLCPRAHIGQFSDLGGAELLAELGGLSGDHLEQVSAAGMAAMAERNVVAVMLPGACVQVRTPPPPIEALRAAGVALALGSDLNPGTSHCETLPIQMWLATTHYGMTVEEAWLGVTRVAAQALGRRDIGILAAGCQADLVLWDAELPAEIPYRYGSDLVRSVVKNGRPIPRLPSPTTR